MIENEGVSQKSTAALWQKSKIDENQIGMQNSTYSIAFCSTYDIAAIQPCRWKDFVKLTNFSFPLSQHCW